MLWMLLSLLCLVHALVQSNRELKLHHILLYVSALLTGVSNDHIFMYLPLVDNFWHGQATVMVSPRFPLYIACVYICILYLPTAYIWRLNIPRYAVPCMTGLLACILYWPFDITGARFLWWTWHDTDSNTIPRLFGVPVASTMWVTTFACSYSFLLHWSLPRAHVLSTVETRKTTTFASLMKPFLVVCLFSVVLMMTHMACVQIVVSRTLPPLLPPPNYTMLLSVLGVYGTIAIYALLTKAPVATPTTAAASESNSSNQSVVSGSPTKLLSAALSLYFTLYVLVAVYGDPTTHVSTGVHQTYGPSEETAVDYSGLSRFVYVSLDNMVHKYYYTFMTENGNPPPDYDDWYTIRGLSSEAARQTYSKYSSDSGSVIDSLHNIRADSIMIWVCSIGLLCYFVLLPMASVDSTWYQKQSHSALKKTN